MSKVHKLQGCKEGCQLRNNNQAREYCRVSKAHKVQGCKGTGGGGVCQLRNINIIMFRVRRMWICMGCKCSVGCSVDSEFNNGSKST